MMAASSRTAPRLVCKVGGSLLDAGRAPAVMEVLRRTAPGLGILALSGGGTAADRIRLRHRRGELDMSEAHWAAVRVLDGNAFRLAGGCGAPAPVVTGLDAASAIRTPAGGAASGAGIGRTPVAGDGPAVMAPSPLLRAEDPLPHSWDVTSDSIAAWLAARCGAARLVLIKARGERTLPGAGSGTGPLPAARAARDGLVDRHLPSLLVGAAYSTWIVNGRHPGRLLAFLTGDETAATLLLS